MHFESRLTRTLVDTQRSEGVLEVRVRFMLILQWVVDGLWGTGFNTASPIIKVLACLQHTHSQLSNYNVPSPN